jgi:hypothetical protein
MGLLGDALGLAKDVGDSMVPGGVHLAEDGYKLATDSHYREQAWNSAVNDAKAAANSAATAVRTADAAKEQFGLWIDSAEKYLEKKVDDGRAWLRESGGAVGQVTSDDIGLVEGGAVSVYDAGKSLVQLANGVQSLTNPIEWAANPDANIARLKSGVQTVEGLNKLANLTRPESWIADPQANERLASALYHSGLTSFEKDPAKFTGNAAATIGLFFIPGADFGDAARGANLLSDAGKIADTANTVGEVGRGVNLLSDAGKAVDAATAPAITQDAGRAAAVSEDAGGAAGAAGKAAAITQDASKAPAITGDASEAAQASDRAGAASRVADGVPDKQGSLRLKYMGATPDKFSRTGAAVVERMRSSGQIVGGGPAFERQPKWS